MTTAEAQQRLQRAFDRLETAARRLADRAAAAPAPVENDPVGNDEAASAEMAKLRQDYAALERVTESASARLDAAIARLSGALEG